MLIIHDIVFHMKRFPYWKLATIVSRIHANIIKYRTKFNSRMDWIHDPWLALMRWLRHDYLLISGWRGMYENESRRIMERVNHRIGDTTNNNEGDNNIYIHTFSASLALRSRILISLFLNAVPCHAWSDIMPNLWSHLLLDLWCAKNWDRKSVV